MFHQRDYQSVEAQFATSTPGARTVRQELDAPAEVVFRCFKDAAAWRQWAGLGVTWTSPEPFGVGTTRTVRLPFFELHEEFVAWEEGRRINFFFASGNLPFVRFSEDYVLTPLSEDRCLLEWHHRLDWGGPLKFIMEPAWRLGWVIGSWVAIKNLARLMRRRGDRWSA